MMHRKLGMTVVLMGLCALPSFAVTPNTTYYVSTNGNDDWSGETPETAFRTIQHAVDVSQDGTTIKVASGRYEPFECEACRSNLVIRSPEGFSKTFIDGGGTNALVRFAPESLCRVEGFTLENGFANASSLGTNAVAGAENVTLSHCIVRQCRANIDGEVYGGILRASPLVNCLVYSNAVVATDMVRGGVCFDCNVYNCTVVDNAVASPAEVRGGGVNGGEVCNAIIVFNRVTDSELVMGENIWYYPDQFSKTYHNADPHFVDHANGDYRLRGDSPCLDAGYDDATDEPTDLDGHARIRGPAIDLGCYEHEQSLSLAPSALAASDVGQPLELGIFADGNWQLATEADWITIADPIGTGNCTNVLALAANTTGARREGKVVLTGVGTDAALTCTVTQVEGAMRRNRYYALCCGIIDFEDAPESALYGCVNDATNILTRCYRSGLWHPGETTLLTNALARYASVRGALTNLAARAVAGDTVLFSFSSHGTNSQGDEKEFDLLCYDKAHGGYYADVTIAEDLLRFKPGVRVIVFLDACCSGGVFKWWDKAPILRLSTMAVSAAERPSLDMAGRLRELMAQKRRPLALKTSSTSTYTSTSTSTSQADILFITAADYDQYSWDDDNINRGMFTGAFCDGWASGEADGEGDGNGKIDFYELYAYAAARAKGFGRPGPFCERTEAQCDNPVLAHAILAGYAPDANVWPDPEIAPDDSEAVKTAKSRDALAMAGFPRDRADAIGGYADYLAITNWATSKGVEVSALASAGTALLSPALDAGGILPYTSKDVAVSSFEQADATTYLIRLALADYDPSRVHASLLKAAVGVTGAEAPDRPFTPEGLNITVTPDEEAVEISVGMPSEKPAYFLRSFVR